MMREKLEALAKESNHGRNWRGEAMAILKEEVPA